MSLKSWRQKQGLTVDALAAALGNIVTPRNVYRYETGEIAADADMIDRIEFLTSGAVTAQDMHLTRLNWLRANRPEKFAPATPTPAPVQP
jgi:predicted transcriptional regulator